MKYESCYLVAICIDFLEDLTGKNCPKISMTFPKNKTTAKTKISVFLDTTLCDKSVS